MRNNMENLVGRKVKYIDDNQFMYFGRKESYEIKHQDSTYFYLIDDNGVRNAIENKRLDIYFELLIDEPKFKQGDKVLASNNKVNWGEYYFVSVYKGIYICVNSMDFYREFKHIKPYEEEIKVGDWVKRKDNGVIFKVDKNDLICTDANNHSKITNPQLIILLNNEL